MKHCNGCNQIRNNDTNENNLKYLLRCADEIIKL